MRQFGRIEKSFIFNLIMVTVFGTNVYKILERYYSRKINDIIVVNQLFWRGFGNPSYLKFCRFKPLLKGSAVFKDDKLYLTENIASQNGQIEWNFHLSEELSSAFYYRIDDVSSAADSVWFYCFAQNTPNDELGKNMGSGFLVGLSEYRACIGIMYNEKKYNKTTGELTNRVACDTDYDNVITGAQLAIKNWRLVEVSIVGQEVQTRVVRLNFDPTTHIKSEVVEYDFSYNFVDVGYPAFDFSHTKFGFGSRSGDIYAAHIIRGCAVVRSPSTGTNGHVARNYLDSPTWESWMNV